MRSYLFDTHIHFFDQTYQKNSRWQSFSLIVLGKENDVGFFCNVGINLKTSHQALEVATQNKNVFAACGYHPTMVNTWDQDSEQALITLLKQPKIVAIGEIGLDFYHKYTTPTQQKEVLHYQLLLAQRFQKPVLLHIRDAYADTWKIVSQYQVKGIVHCFSGTHEQAQLFIDKGFYISFSGVLTFHNAKALQQVARQIALKHIVLETDAPYLTPAPFRGQVNLPSYLRYTAEKLAELHDITYDEVVIQTTKNAFAALQIDHIFLSE